MRFKMTKSTLTISMLAALLAAPLLTGCAGVAEGFARGMVSGVSGGQDTPDTRQCLIRGQAFAGLAAFMRRQEQTPPGQTRPTLKVLLVHGIGDHQPGHGTRLAENLARALNLTRTEAQFKQFNLASPHEPEAELGVLRISRFVNTAGNREMLFYELTWDPIVEAEKQTIAFDNSGEYAFRRAGINNAMKLFVNTTVPDALMYQGQSRERIQISVAQAMCWMFSNDWASLPDQARVVCDPDSPNFLSFMDDDYAFMTHSLGSRIMTDSLQRIAQLADANALLERVDRLQDKRLPVFMLSNQLPLLQLGQPKPEVVGQTAEICAPGAPRASQRLFAEVTIVAFSDPNDLLSYSIPPGFLDEHVDSRLCPSLVNVIINISEVINVFGLGEVANPLTAHLEYENDDRVIALMAYGIGTDQTAPIVTERCEWLETI